MDLEEQLGKGKCVQLCGGWWIYARLCLICLNLMTGQYHLSVAITLGHYYNYIYTLLLGVRVRVF